MNKTITLVAILVFGIQFCNASTALPVNPVIKTIVTDVKENSEATEDRVYFWKVSNANSSASGYVFSLEKAESMIKKVSKGDYNRTIVVMSNPR